MLIVSNANAKAGAHPPAPFLASSFSMKQILPMAVRVVPDDVCGLPVSPVSQDPLPQDLLRYSKDDLVARGVRVVQKQR